MRRCVIANNARKHTESNETRPVNKYMRINYIHLEKALTNEWVSDGDGGMPRSNRQRLWLFPGRLADDGGLYLYGFVFSVGNSIISQVYELSRTPKGYDRRTSYHICICIYIYI